MRSQSYYEATNSEGQKYIHLHYGYPKSTSTSMLLGREIGFAGFDANVLQPVEVLEHYHPAC